MTAGEVTAVVPVKNRRDLLERLLAGLRGQTWPPAEVLVVDNGSEDGAADLAERMGARVIRMGTNTGFSRAVNRGIRECRTEWLALINSDVELAPDWLEQLCRAAQGHPEAWYVTGKILSATDPERIDGTFDLMSRGACAWRAGAGARDGPAFSAGREIWSAPGTAALFRAELFQRVGMLEESFESYLEDVDLGIRCACQGYSGWYAPEARVWHWGSATLGRWHPDVVYLIARNQVLLVARHYPARLLLRCAWSILAGQVLWGLVAVRHASGWAYVRGKAAGLRQFRNARKHTPPQDANRLDQVLERGEREISNIQRQSGLALYWRVYLLLTRGGTK
jgi:GT2 family glycosyltransferase